MAIGSVILGGVTVSRMVMGGNPFSGFSHQSPQRDDEMRRYYTTARIKQTFREAEAAGINTFFGRADRHVMRVLMEYWDEGGKIQWFAQTCPEFAPHSRGISNAIHGGASGCYIHGGQMDFWLAQNQTDGGVVGCMPILIVHHVAIKIDLAGVFRLCRIIRIKLCPRL